MVLFRHVNADVPLRWNGSGETESWGLARKLDATTVSRFFEPARDIVTEVQKIDPALAETLDFGTLRLNADINARVEALAFGVGLGHDTMIVAHTSFWNAQTRVQGSFESSTSLKTAAQKLKAMAETSPDKDRARIIGQVLERLPTVEGANLQDVLVSSYGYQPIGSWAASGIGDTQIFIHKRLANKTTHAHAVRVGAILATGRKDDPDQLTDIPFGLGHNAAYAEWMGDAFAWGDRLIVSATGKLQYGFEFRRDTRLIEDPLLPLAARKENLRIAPGERFTTRLALDGKVYRDLRVYTHVQRESRAADRIKGAEASFDYGRLGRESATTTDTWELGLKYSTVSAYRAGRAPVPFDISASYNRVFGGRNTELIEMAFADVQFYF